MNVAVGVVGGQSTRIDTTVQTLSRLCYSHVMIPVVMHIVFLYIRANVGEGKHQRRCQAEE